MKKNNKPTIRTMPRHEANERSEPPSPQAIIERQRAEAAAARNPLAFSMGEPLPGRSALDKIRAKQKAAEAGVCDNVIVLDKDRRQYGSTNRVSPGMFLPTGSKRHGHDG